MKNPLVFLLSLVAVCGIAPAIQADVIDTGAQSFTGTGIFDTMLSFAPFDSTLGTLLSVDIVPAATASGTVTVTNNNTSGPEQMFAFTVDEGLAISGHGAKLSLAPSFSGSTNLGAGDTYTSPTTTGPSVSTSQTLTTNLAAFESGPVDLMIHGLGLVSISGPTNVSISAISAANGTVDVLYNFTPATSDTPEPGTFLMAGGALMGLGLLGQRHFRALK